MLCLIMYTYVTFVNEDYGLTEEAARLIIKWYRTPRFGQMYARSKLCCM